MGVFAVSVSITDSEYASSNGGSMIKTSSTEFSVQNVQNGSHVVIFDFVRNERSVTCQRYRRELFGNLAFFLISFRFIISAMPLINYN